MKWLEYERKEQITLKLFEHSGNVRLECID